MIFGFFRKLNAKKESERELVRKIGNIELKIIPNFAINSEITISEEELKKISEIISEEKSKPSKICGYIIAERICKEVNPDKFCSVDVEGSKDGTKWVIKLSNIPF